jgi:hypothetical protein
MWHHVERLYARLSLVLLFFVWDVHFEGLQWASARDKAYTLLFAALVTGLTAVGASGFRHNRVVRGLVLATSAFVMSFWAAGFFLSPDPVVLAWPFMKTPVGFLAIFTLFADRTKQVEAALPSGRIGGSN